MTKSDSPSPAPAKKGEKKLILAVVLGLVVLGGAYYASLGGGQGENLDTPEAAGVDAGAVEQAYRGAEEAKSIESSFDLEKAKTERVLGDASAPIKITEHASLTCSHCAHFHEATFETFKKDYIDTGKAYLVFSDFPLNAPALHATMAARCLPEESYFNFIKALFAEQSQWASDVGYITYLKGKALEFGLSEEKFTACMQSEPLQNAILERMKAVQKQWNIASTPSFVVNNQVVISGALPPEEFARKIEEALEQIKNGTVNANHGGAVSHEAHEGAEAPAAPETKAEGE